MTEWQILPLGEALTFQRGFDITKDGQRDGPYPVISSSGPKTTHAEYKVRGPGVVIGRKGSLGTVFYSEADYWPHDTTLWVKDFHGNDPRFAYYFLQTMGFERLDAGASNPSLNRNHIHTIPVRWPSLPVQRRIAGILSVYDDLIENNQRRIKILEEMARSLYREWFVHFRFPGHDKVKMVPSSLGQIPQGWEVKKLGDVADISWGDTSTTKASYVEEGFAAYSASGLDGKLDHYDFDRTGIVLSAIGAQCGKTWLARGKWSCIKNTIRFWSKDGSISTEFVFIATEDQNFWPRRGAAQPFISQGEAEQIDLLIPDRAMMKRFTIFAAASLERIATLEAQNQNLRCTRDLLLPRLLSGQIELKSMDAVA